MREVKKQGSKFADVESGRMLLCAYNQENQCSNECTACESNHEGIMTTFDCLRGSFTFGQTPD